MKRLIRLSVFFSLLYLSPFASAADYDVIVVGSGGGGLGAAATLVKAGKRVLLLEQHHRFGGYMSAFTRGDYRFEISLHAFDAAGPGGHNEKQLSEFGVMDKVRFHRLEPFYRSVYPDRVIDVPTDPDEFLEMMIEMFPSEQRGLEELFETMTAIYEDVMGLVDLHSYSWPRRAWTYMTIPVTSWDMVKWRNKTLDELFDAYIDDEKAKGMLGQLWTYIGLKPQRMSAVYFAVMWGSFRHEGCYYPEGGSQAISNAIIEFIRENGGTAKSGALVERIIVEDERVVGVRTADGDIYTAPFVVSNVNLLATVDKLVGSENFPLKYVQRIRSMEQSISLAHLYFGIRDRSVLAPLGGAHSTFYNAGYDPQDSYNAAMRGDIEKVGLTIVDYGPHDPGCAPNGASVLSVTVPFQYGYKDDWGSSEGREGYQAAKLEVIEGALIRLEKLLPGVREQIDVVEGATPLTMQLYTLNPGGAIYGFAHTPEQSNLNRPQNNTPVKGLYLAGAWTFPGAGQSACLLSGKIAAQMILRKMD